MASLPPGAAPNACAPLSSPANAPAPAIAFDKHRLPNGLQVILVEDRRLPVVAVNLCYHVGPANEPPGLSGLAHLFEHLMFAGTRHLPRGLADRLLEGAGATDSNGGTGYDSTSYYDTVPANQLALALWIHADRMGYLLDVLDQEALANQQDVVRNERRQTVENEAYGVVEEALAQALFPASHPYAASIIGSHADIQRATLDDVREFFIRHYSPNNASLVLVGDFDKREALALVTRYFGSLRAGPSALTGATPAPPLAQEKRLVVRDRIELPRLYMGWITPPAYAEDDAELMVAAHILGGGKSSRLFKSLVYTHRIAHDVSASQTSLKLGSTFIIDATLRAGQQLEQLERLVDAELAQLASTGPAPHELERALNSLETSLLATIEKRGGDGLAEQLNHYNFYTGDPGYLAHDLARLRRIDCASVQQAVARWLGRDARAVVAAKPGKPRIDDPRSPVAAPPASSPVPAELLNVPEPWRATPPQAAPLPPCRLPQAERFVLPNGLTVLHHHNPALPLVSTQLVVRSGGADNPPHLPGLAGFTAQMLEEGTSTRSALDIADEIARLGAFMDTGSSDDISTVTLLALRATFADALAVMADVVLHPAFPAEEVERQRQDRLGSLSMQWDDPEIVAALAAAHALFGATHPKGYGQLGTKAAVRATTRDDLVNFWRSHYVPGNAALVVSGGITRAELEQLANACFGPWPAAPRALEKHLAPQPLENRLVLVDQPDSGQTALQVTCMGPARDTPDFAALQVMNAVLGGMFSSRLNNSLREQKGVTYGIYSHFDYDRGPSPFAVETSVQQDATGETVREILREIDRLRDEPIPGDELEAARCALQLSLPGQFETNGDIVASLTELFTYDLAPDYYDRLGSLFGDVTAEHVQQAAKRWLEPANMHIVAVGERKVLLKQLGPLGTPVWWRG